jgi:hypothetical protein
MVTTNTESLVCQLDPSGEAESFKKFSSFARPDAVPDYETPGLLGTDIFGARLVCNGIRIIICRKCFIRKKKKNHYCISYKFSFLNFEAVNFGINKERLNKW